MTARSRARDLVYQCSAGLNFLVQNLRAAASRRSPRVWGSLLLYMIRKSALRRKIPYYVAFSLTDRCVCRCGHCHRPLSRDDARPELTTEEVLAVIDDLHRLGVYMIFLTGGEPMLRADLLEIVRHARRRGFLTVLQTTGWLLDREALRALKTAGLDRCAVSIDDADPAVHDEIRGRPGAQAKALEAIGLIREAGIQPAVNCCVSKRLMAAAPDGTTGLAGIIRLAKSRGTRFFLALAFVASGRSDGAFDQVLDGEDTERMRRYQDPAFFRMEWVTSRTNCEAFRKSALHVDATGNVTPCSYIPFALGNVRDHPLRVLWKGYADGTDFVLRGACPMNDVANREKLRRHIASVAEGLKDSGIR